MNQENIGKFIAKRRKELKLTQEELAEKLYVSSKTISRWETGASGIDLSMLNILSEVLDVSINDILSGEMVPVETRDNTFQKNTITIISRIDKKQKLFSILLIILLIILTIFIIYNVFLNNYYYTIPYSKNNMYIDNSNEYGIRLVDENNCASLGGKFKSKEIKYNNETIIFVQLLCNISLENNYIKNSSNIVKHFYYFNIPNNKYKIYYTSDNLNNVNKQYIQKYLKKSNLIYES